MIQEIHHLICISIAVNAVVITIYEVFTEDMLTDSSNAGFNYVNISVELAILRVIILTFSISIPEVY